jgi:hypothetical protein
LAAPIAGLRISLEDDERVCWLKFALSSESGPIDAWIAGSVSICVSATCRNDDAARTIGKGQLAQYTQSGPQIGYRADPIRPMAKIVLETDSHEQLDSILLALSRAISAEQQAVKRIRF